MTIIFMITWATTYVACRLGATTITNGWGEERWGRIPGTLVVATLTCLLSFIVLLFMGQVHT